MLIHSVSGKVVLKPKGSNQSAITFQQSSFYPALAERGQSGSMFFICDYIYDFLRMPGET